MPASLINARRAIAAHFALCGFVLGIWVVHIPEIRDRVGLSFHDLGFLLLLFGLSAFVAMTYCGRIIDRVGSRRILVLAAAAVSLTVIGPSFAQSRFQLGVAIVVLGLANGFMDASQNAHAVEIENAYGRPILSAVHAFFSIGGLVAAIVGAVSLAVGINIHVVFIGAGLLGLLTVFVCRPYLLPRSSLAVRRAPVLKGAWSPRILLLGSIAFSLFMAEGVAFDWSSLHLRDVLGADKSVAAFGFGAFSVTMTLVRLLADRVIERIGSVTYVRVGTLIATAGIALAVASTNVATAIVAWSVFGMGLAGCVPQIMSAAGRLEPDSSGPNVTRVVALGFVGHLSGPSMVGFVADQLGLRTALAIAIACCLYACAMSRRALTAA